MFESSANYLNYILNLKISANFFCVSDGSGALFLIPFFKGSKKSGNEQHDPKFLRRGTPKMKLYLLGTVAGGAVSAGVEVGVSVAVGGETIKFGATCGVAGLAVATGEFNGDPTGMSQRCPG